MNEKKNIILAYGNKEFNNSLYELRNYLNFDLKISDNLGNTKDKDNYKGFLIHQDALKNKETQDLIEENNKNKIIVYHSKKIKGFENIEKFSLPITVNQLNETVTNNIISSVFKSNSSFKINNYRLDKNSRKLSKNNKSLELTEKEIKLIELLYKKNFTKKKEILSIIWKYSNDADTHTVETHIYRLRKKIKEIFNDEFFIKSEKQGYTI